MRWIEPFLIYYVSEYVANRPSLAVDSDNVSNHWIWYGIEQCGRTLLFRNNYLVRIVCFKLTMLLFSRVNGQKISMTT